MMVLALVAVTAVAFLWRAVRRDPGGPTATLHESTPVATTAPGRAVTTATTSVRPRPVATGLPVPVRVIVLVARHTIWPPLRWAGRRLWTHRDLHACWWLATLVYATGWAAHQADAAWSASAYLLLAAGLHDAQRRWDLLPVHPETLAGLAVVAGAWTAAAAVWDPVNPRVAWPWAAISLLVFASWWYDPGARAWRSLRIRVRNWRSALPVVLAELGAAGVVVASVGVDGHRRVEFRLRLPVKVTRKSLEKLRDEIVSGMHWPEGSIREITQDPAHTSAARVILVWQDGKIQARVVRFDPAKIPASIYDPLWLGHDDQGRDVFVEQYTKTGMTRGLYGGEPGSAKSNLLRLIALLRAYCPDVLIWVIDRKNSGLTFAALLPRIDWIATTRDEATLMLQAAAAAIPLRGRLLRPEHNQLLPLSAEIPGLIILFDEFSAELGKGKPNSPAVEAAKTLFSQGRATGLGAEIASQYLSKTSLDPDLKPLFPRNYCGRTRNRSDGQFLLKDWSRIDPTTLPPGAFFVQQSGESSPWLLYTPEVTDAMLMEAAAETVELAPRLEESTASQLPGYADRWTRLPEHLLAYCSPEQRRQAAADKEEAFVRVAAAAKPRLVVTERLPPERVEDIADESLRALCSVLLSSPTASTADLDAAVAPRRSRQWASERRSAWKNAGLIEQTTRGSWRLIVGEEELARGVAEAEETLRSRRSPRPVGAR
jgi:hypothetical protein